MKPESGSHPDPLLRNSGNLCFNEAPGGATGWPQAAHQDHLGSPSPSPAPDQICEGPRGGPRSQAFWLGPQTPVDVPYCLPCEGRPPGTSAALGAPLPGGARRCWALMHASPRGPHWSRSFWDLTALTVHTMSLAFIVYQQFNSKYSLSSYGILVSALGPPTFETASAKAQRQAEQGGLRELVHKSSRRKGHRAGCGRSSRACLLLNSLQGALVLIFPPAAVWCPFLPEMLSRSFILTLDVHQVYLRSEREPP